MGQPRAAARPRRSGDSSCAEDGPPPPFRSWQAPPDGLFDVIVPKLTARQFVVVQLVCKDWSRSARSCLKDATPKRPDVDLSKLVTLYPNLTQLNLSFVEGLSTRKLTPLRHLTALRELCLSNVSLQLQQPTVDAGGGANAPAQHAPTPAPATSAEDAAATAAAVQPTSPTAPHTRSRSKSLLVAVRKPPLAAATRTSESPHQLGKSPSETKSGPDSSTEAVADSPAFTLPSQQRARRVRQQRQRQQQQQQHEVEEQVPAPACAALTATAVAPTTAGAGAVTAAEAGGIEPAGTAAGMAGARPPSSPAAAASAAARMFGGLGDVLLRLTKLQADLCPALTAEALACLPNLTDLTVDTLVAPVALAPLPRLRCLAVKKLANPEALDRLSGLTALLVNSDSSCASDFLSVCTRLPELQSLTFKTSSTKILQQPDTLCWHGFSGLSSLDLRAPAECLKSGLPALAELGALRSLALDLYCASDDEMMVTVVAPPNLDSLSVSSDRSRSGGVIDVHPNPRLRSLRIRLYWTALNLVLPDGLPEPSPLPEPLSEDLELDPDPGVARLDPDHPDPAGVGGRRGVAATAGTPRSPGGAVTAAAHVSGRRLRPHECSSGGGGGPRPPGGGGGGGSPVRGTRRRLTPTRTEEPPGSSGRRRRRLAEPPSSAATETGTAVYDGDRGAGERGVPPPTWGSAGPCGVVSVDGGEQGAAARGGEVGATLVDLTVASAGGGGGGVTPQPCGSRPAGGGGGSSRERRGRSSGGGAAAAAASYGTPVRSCRRNSSGGDGGSGISTPSSSSNGGAGGGVLPEMQLKDLCLDACFFLLYGSLVPVLQQFPHLHSLTLDNCLALENGELSQLCELSGLRQVSLSGLHLVTDSGLRALSRLPRLASLKVKGLCKLAMHAVQAFRRQKPFVRTHEEISGSFLTSLSPLRELRSLTLKHLHTARAAALTAGLGALPQLTRLEVKDVPAMSDTVLHALTGHTGLQELSVLHCEAVTLYGRNAMVRSLGVRVALDFDGCSLPDITRPCELPSISTLAQLIEDDQASSSNQPRRSCQHSNQH